MKYAIIFRRLKNVKYSFVPLIASLEKTDYLDQIDLLSVKKIEDIKQYDGLYHELTIAFSFMTFNLDQIINDLDSLQKMDLKTPYFTIAGGPHISGDPLSGIKLGFNSIFLGDGEYTIRQYCLDLLQDKRQKIYDGRINPIDLNDYPPFATEKYTMVIPIEITRGCLFGCKYCAVSYLYGEAARKPRYRNIEQILEYTRWCAKRKKYISRFISPNAFAYQSRNGITPNLEALEELLNGIKKAGAKESYLGTFPSEVRPESVSEDVLRLIKKYCSNDSLVIGVQSGSERMLKLMGRGHDLETAEQAISLTQSFGLIPMVDFIFGLPGEMENDRLDTIKWMEKINTKYGVVIHAHTFLPLVGSPWANKYPEQLDRKTIQTLGRLSLNQSLYGQWTKQQKLGEKIICWRKQGIITN